MKSLAADGSRCISLVLPASTPFVPVWITNLTRLVHKMNYSKFVIALLVTGLSLVSLPRAFGCLWDYDTLLVERSRFPQVLELITGKFLRHSPEFYRWRISDRQAKLGQADTSDLATAKIYDDLAVAFDKIGEHDQAIATAQMCEELFPGRYETSANLGTFLVHAGRYAEGLQEIEKAIAINPAAHFGREVYQKLLVEYLLANSDASGEYKLPLGETMASYAAIRGFAAFVLERQGLSAAATATQDRELKKALKGILGMMRFGNFDSPILLEALGDLLIANRNTDAKRLAARAYLKAGYEVDNSLARAGYRNFAKSILEMQTVHENTHTAIKPADLELNFKQELDEAENWYATVRRDEQQWIADGVDVDQAFTEKYFGHEPEIGVDKQLTNSSGGGALAGYYRNCQCARDRRAAAGWDNLSAFECVNTQPPREQIERISCLVVGLLSAGQNYPAESSSGNSILSGNGLPGFAASALLRSDRIQ